ncbi:MAG: class I adenylate cyclase [Pseudomonadota bacterium]
MVASVIQLEPDALGRARVNAALASFRAHHEYRHAQTLKRLAGSHAQFLLALPLLVHYNHRRLPGYCPGAPSGIPEFKPTPAARQVLASLVGGLPQMTVYETEIEAIFYMGSAGTAAHTRDSDIDVWVVVANNRCDFMQEKLRSLEQWAKQRGVDLQAFAVSTQQFRAGSGVENSPLLLDEFYRSACWLAGRAPAWWAVPIGASDAHRRLVREVVEQRVVDRKSLVDFGPVPDFSTRDLLAAALLELGRAFDTPYKSLLKLALLETYAAGAPSLAETYKRHVLEDRAHEELDPYLLLAERLDEHFSGQSRLSFLRRAWLIKSGRGNARLSRQHPWWRLAQAWGYADEGQLDHLRYTENWTIQQLLTESNRLHSVMREGLLFVRQLIDRAQQQYPAHAIADLKDAFSDLSAQMQEEQQRPEHIWDAIAPTRYQRRATVTFEDGAWEVREDRCIHRAESFSHLVHWLVSRGVGIDKIQESSPCYAVLRRVMNEFYAHQSVVLVNPDLLVDHRGRMSGEFLLSAQDDPLSYGREQRCLARIVDIIDHDLGPTTQQTLVAAIAHLAEQQGTVTVLCARDLIQQRIARRVQHLIEDCRGALEVTGNALACQIGDQTVILTRTLTGVYCSTVASPADFDFANETLLHAASTRLPAFVRARCNV